MLSNFITTNTLNDLLLYLENITPSFVWSVLAVGYAGAGLLLIVNLYRNRFLKGNILGIAAAVIFLTTAAAFSTQSFFTSTTSDRYFFQAAINIAAFIAIYGFMVMSFRKQFVIGGYQALTTTREQLEQHERWMKIMQERMTDGLAVFSASGRLLYINPAALDLLNLNFKSAMQRRDLMFGVGYKTDKEVEDMKSEVLHNREEINTKIIINHGTPQQKVVEVRLSPVFGRFKKVIAISALYRDITDIDELEKAKEEFIQIASHELRTPLTAVKGYLSLLKMKRYGDLHDKQKSLVERAILASNHLSKLVDNLLTVARIEESKLSLNPEMADIEELVDTVVKELAGEADRRSISIKILSSKKQLPLMIVDQDKLQQVLVNLIGNAIKYTPEGGNIYIETKLKRRGKVQVSVSDTGIGIPKEELNKLFRKFERIKNNRSAKVGGSGLGLVIVKSFVELHGGEIDVKSSEGHGSTFTITLPIIQNIHDLNNNIGPTLHA